MGKRPGLDVDYSPLSSIEWSFTSISAIRLHCMDRENSAFQLFYLLGLHSV